MTGPQVVEVVIIDSDINETNESNGEPKVTVNGAKLRMAQATDGNWYGYFAVKISAIGGLELIHQKLNLLLLSLQQLELALK
jgi:hypothetical protein